MEQVTITCDFCGEACTEFRSIFHEKSRFVSERQHMCETCWQKAVKVFENHEEVQ